MPAPPEVRYGHSEIRALKVLHQLKAHDLRRADGDIGIARKVTVNLKREENRRNQHSRAFVVIAVIEHLIDQNRGAVSNDNFEEEAPHHPKQTVADVIVFQLMRRVELRQEVGRTFNRPGDQLREEADERRVLDEIRLHAHVAAVNINDIRQRLKDVERDANRQQHVKTGCDRRKTHPPANNVEVIDGKVEILVEEENREVDSEGHADPDLGKLVNRASCLCRCFLLGTPFPNQQAEKERDCRGEKQQQRIRRIPVHVEQVRRQKNPKDAQFARNRVV